MYRDSCVQIATWPADMPILVMWGQGKQKGALVYCLASQKAVEQKCF